MITITRETVKKVVTVIAVIVLVACNVLVAADHGEKMYSTGLNHGCNEGFDYFLRKQYGLRELPPQLQMEIATLCVDALPEGKP